MASSSTEFSLVLSFGSLGLLQTHLTEMDEFLAWRDKRRARKSGDRRGRHIAGLHAAAAAHRADHPELSYKECMKAVGRPHANPEEEDDDCSQQTDAAVYHARS